MSDVIELKKYQVKRYGWIKDLPDHRDHIFEPVHDEQTVPGKVDLSPFMPPIYDQAQLGSCTGNGWARVVQARAIKQGIVDQAQQVPSRLFIYYGERVIENSVASDAGAQVRSGAQVVATQGVPPESLWPYSDADPGPFQQQPPQNVYDAAKKEEALEYQRIQLGGGGAPFRSALAQGYPIVFGFPVPDYFENASKWNPASGAPLPVPDASARIIGGHCVVATGYDFTGEQFEPYVQIDNSWGAGWGMGGRFRMHYHWFTQAEQLAGDFWIVKSVS